MSDASLKILTLPDGRLGVDTGSGPVPVTVTRCFPWTHPGRHLSLRDGEGDEIAFVNDPETLDPDSHSHLNRELQLTGQTFEIIGIHAVAKEIELRCWEVVTPGGDRHFQTELDEWPRHLSDGSLLIQDLFGDLYRIPDPHALDPASRKILLPLLG